MKALLWKWLAFAVLLALAMALGRDWRGANDWFFATLFMPTQAEPDPHILLLELADVGADDPSSKDFRELLGHTLEMLATRGPDRVAVDVAVLAGGKSLPAVARGVAALRQAGIDVYFGIHPRLDPKTLAKEIYEDAPLTGVGHTELRLGGGLVFFHSVVKQPDSGKEYRFLPAMLADVDAFKLPDYQVISVPKDSSRPLGVRIDKGVASTLPARLTGRIVIIASSERECRQLRASRRSAVCSEAGGPRLWSGPELLVWSLSDLLQGRETAPRQPVDAPLWVFAAALGVAATGLVVHVLSLRGAGRVWSPTQLARRLWLIDLGVLLAVLVLFAFAEWLLVQLDWILPPVFPLFAGVVAIALCHWHSRTHLATMLAAVTRRATDNALKADVDIFISYSHAPENAVWVEREIVEPLRSMKLPDGRPLRLFFDKSSITVGDDWFGRINLSILGSRCFLCIWSDDYLERDYCLWELNYAFPRAARRDFLFLPVANLSGGAQPGPDYVQYLQARQYINAAVRQDFIDELKTVLAQHFALLRP